MSTTTLPGLTSAEVAERLARGQVNRVRRSHAAEYRDIVARNVFTLFNALVVPAAVALFLLEDYKAAVAVSGMGLTNTVLGLVQEVRAKRHLDRLALLAETRARVVRAGRTVEVALGDVVQDDILLLAAGDAAVADGTVLEAHFLEVDEALLTGESDPVTKRAGDKLLSGSFCVAGEGSYRADRVGAAAFAQKTASEARTYRYTASPLQLSINRLIRILTAAAVLLCGLYLVLYFVRPFPTTDLVQMIAATITSMVPQGLVLMATFAFILGAVRMSRRGAIVQRLNAVESMASIDTLCMDKTGTLTTNRLKLEWVRSLDGNVDEEQACQRLCLFASACTDHGSKSVLALRAALGEAPVELLDQIPFKSQNRFSAVRVRAGQAEHVLALGAFESLRPMLQDDTVSAAERTWAELMKTGLRLLLLGECPGPTCAPAPLPQRFDGSLGGFVLCPVALLALSDELREEAGSVLRGLAGQGIEFKILSGDNPETVRAAIRPLGKGAAEPALRALADTPVVTGADLEAAADPGVLVRERAVFGRVSPWQKVEIVAALKAQGRHVAMIGDGVNDVLPIKNAHLGIAMGEGSRASKTVSGLVLETNNFELLPETLDEGRTILRNLRRAGKVFLVKNVYMLLLIVGALGVFSLPFPVLPQQVTLLNALTIGVPALFIALSKQRSTAATRPGFLRDILWFTVRTGVVIGLAGLLVMLRAGRIHDDLGAVERVQMQRTQLLTLLVVLGLTTLLRVLTDGEHGAGSSDRRLRWFVAAALPLYLIALYWPLAADFFVLAPLSLEEWGEVLSVAGPACLLLLASDRLTATSAAARPAG
jgi:magnesium-transporting ATPase (P-type)